MSGERVDIYGAGPAGLVAAIELIANGFDVHIYDRYGVGGNRAWHPSIQTVAFHPSRTWDYIGIDLSPCFHKVEAITFHRYGRKKVFSLENMHVCERGPRAGSLDRYLLDKAMSMGAVVTDGIGFSANQPDSAGHTIVATGLDTAVYEELGIPHTPIYGYRGVADTQIEPTLITYMAQCTNYDFAYLAADQGTLFALLFSRKQLATDSLNEFQQLLRQTEGIEIDRWTCSTGSVPTQAQLFHKGQILAGTLSGMIDPFLLSGISGALISGKIAAQAVIDPESANSEFRWFTRNFSLKQHLKALSTRIPFKQLSIPLMMLVDSRIRGVGFIA